MLTLIVSPRCRCKCSLGCEGRKSREDQRERLRGCQQAKAEKQRGRCGSRLGWSLAPVCSFSQLTCHPDPEGADSRVGEKRLLMLLGDILFSFFEDMGLFYFDRRKTNLTRAQKLV